MGWGLSGPPAPTPRTRTRPERSFCRLAETPPDSTGQTWRVTAPAQTDQASRSTTEPVALHSTGLGRAFGELWAVRGLDLEVHRGRVLGLLGPNGAGKTTTVRLLTALIEPTEGTATIDGFDVRADPDAVRARVGILTETPGLYDKLTAEANLDFFGRLYSLDAATRAVRIEHYLRSVSACGSAGATSPGPSAKA